MSTLSPRRRARLATAVLLLATAISGACADRQTGPVAPAYPGVRPHASAFAPVTVTTTADNGPGSLRDAISTSPAGTTIHFDPTLAGDTIALTSRLTLDGDTILGPVPGGIVIAGNGTDVVLDVEPGNALLRDLTVTGGSYTVGGAIYVHGGLALDHVLLTGNHAGKFGGGVGVDSGSLAIVNSTITGNTGSETSAIWSLGPVAITYSTIAGNAASFQTAAVRATTLTLANSIVANNTGPLGSTECPSGFPGVSVVLAGVNLVDDTSCGPAGGNLIVADPQLDTLADNGGPSRTLALLRTSPAIDAAGACTVSDDQRHVARPQGAGCDIGAFEFDAFVHTGLAASDAVAVDPTSGVAVATGTLTCPEPLTLTVQAALTEPQKAGRVNTTVSATGQATLACDGTTPWSVALAPPTGAFQVGTGTLNVISSGARYVIPDTSSTAVRLFWGHK